MLVINKNNIEITNDDIKYAEKILLKNWWTFDDERRNFIKNLDTIDLEAVPGSGKTTALLAKLLILERKMPFENGVGILVLSHTNTAVDEIKDKLEKIAPKLFKFPNFIGTIQSFVDTFLTKPYGLSFLNINFNNIDDDYYWYHIIKKFNKIRKDKEYWEIWKFLYWRNIGRAKIEWKWNNQIINNICEKYIIDDVKNLFYDFSDEKIKFLDNNKTFLKDKNNLKFQWFSKIILETLQEWFLSYKYAYHLAFCYLEKFPKIIKILQKRFQYVFVDEMQDMEQHQVDILEKLFYKKFAFNHCFQRIWDKNQAIYSGFEADDIDNSRIWNRKILKIEWSHRLTESISKVVNCFQIEWDTKIIWKNTLEKWDIKPIMIVYKENDLNTENWWENKILQKFWEIIEEKKEYFKNIPDDKFICKAIISNAKMHDTWFQQDKCRAKHYFSDYDENFSKSKTSHWLKSLKDYLYYYDKNDSSLNSKYKNILKLFLRILRESNIENFYRKEQLFSFLQEGFPEKSLEFKDKMYYFCRNLNDNNIEEISKEMDYFFIDFISGVFGENIKTGIFESKLSENVEKNIGKKDVNTFVYDDLKIPVCTTHSVKWETHTCTLYMESGNHYYEVEQIAKENFLWNQKPLGFYWKKFSKLMYVWFSRPTHLLCFAIWEERYNKFLKANEEKLEEFWEIVWI